MKFKRIYELIVIIDNYTGKILTITTNIYNADLVPKDRIELTTTMEKHSLYFDNQEEFLIEFKHFLRGVK